MPHWMGAATLLMAESPLPHGEDDGERLTAKGAACLTLDVELKRRSDGEDRDRALHPLCRLRGCGGGAVVHPPVVGGTTEWKVQRVSVPDGGLARYAVRMYGPVSSVSDTHGRGGTASPPTPSVRKTAASRPRPSSPRRARTRRGVSDYAARRCRSMCAVISSLSAPGFIGSSSGGRTCTRRAL